MKHLMVLAVFFLLSLSSAYAADASHHVLVSVAPHAFFVKKIAGDTISVNLMVPAGASAHTFEPTPRQMLEASKADIWFCIGEGFEARAIKALKAHNLNLEISDLRKGVEMITADPLSGQCCCHANCQDLHIWLSARQAKIQAATIANALSRRYPEHSALYQKNLHEFQEELTALDQKIQEILQPLKDRLLMVSHPAYAYFCRDYQLEQLSIEFEGKDPTPQQLTTVLTKARAAHISKVYIQPQYNSKGAKLFAQELHAEVVVLDPYSENYINSMLEIARAFSSN